MVIGADKPKFQACCLDQLYINPLRTILLTETVYMNLVKYFNDNKRVKLLISFTRRTK